MAARLKLVSWQRFVGIQDNLQSTVYNLCRHELQIWDLTLKAEKFEPKSSCTPGSVPWSHLDLEEFMSNNEDIGTVLEITFPNPLR